MVSKFTPHVKALMKDYRAQRWSQQQPPLTLSTLPLDTFLLIVDELPLSSRFALSLTCKPLHAAIYPSCTAAKGRLDVWTDEHADFLFEIADIFQMHNHISCMKCNKLHQLEPSDLPWATLSVRSTCAKPKPTTSPLANIERYRIGQQHIQAALKLSRSGSQDNRLGELLKLHEVKYTLQHGWEASEQAEAAIIDSSFVLWQSETFRHSSQYAALPVRISQIRYMSLCAHLEYDHPTHLTEPRPNGLVTSLQTASQGKDRVIHGSCTRCPTDYTVQVTGKYFKVERFQNFGSSGRPGDLHWVIQSHKDKDNNVDRGPTIEHLPGSIRGLFLDAKKDGQDTVVTKEVGEAMESIEPVVQTMVLDAE